MVKQKQIAEYTNRPWYLSEDEPTCPDCGDTFQSEHGVRNHYTLTQDEVHEKPYPWYEQHPCPECGELFYRKVNTRNRNQHCSKSCANKTDTYVKRVPFVLEGSHGYPRWRTSNFNVAVHQLIAIAEGAKPGKVFKNNSYSVDHKNGMKIDNRHDNIELLPVEEHGKKDRERQNKMSKYSHEHMLSIVSFFTPLGDDPDIINTTSPEK